MAVMEEVHSQMTEITGKQKEKVDELGAEIRKLKAMIVKHESRIRTLENKNRELEAASAAGGGGGGNGQAASSGSAGEDMDPDEV
jgi:predicted RNase H-like nuclease (RuvC/YqgF family)